MAELKYFVIDRSGNTSLFWDWQSDQWLASADELNAYSSEIAAIRRYELSVRFNRDLKVCYIVPDGVVIVEENYLLDLIKSDFLDELKDSIKS